MLFILFILEIMTFPLYWSLYVFSIGLPLPDISVLMAPFPIKYLKCFFTSFHQQFLSLLLSVFPSDWLLTILFGILSVFIQLLWSTYLNPFILIKIPSWGLQVSFLARYYIFFSKCYIFSMRQIAFYESFFQN